MKSHALLAAAFSILTIAADACTLPVFRYALDRWAPDAFHLKVSPEDAAKPEVAKFMRNFSAASALNLDISRFQETPSRLLRPDSPINTPNPFWTGSITDPFLESLSKSEYRDEIVRRILAGDSAVFVLVESEDAIADNKAAEALEKRLRFLQNVVQIPAADPTDPSSKPGPGPELKVQFSVLRIPGRHTAPKIGSTTDNLLLQMLAGPKSGLEESTEPWVAAVFGRGRVLGAWPSPTFGDEQIEEVALFLAGACSCQVKRQNPGWDLLLHVDWDEALLAQAPPGSSLPAHETKPKYSEPTPETVQINPSPAPSVTPAPDSPPQTRRPSTGFAGILGAAFGIVAGVIIRKLRNRK
ncbi:MAG: hypothetical protein WCO60_10100 [Verrucomicrobiota bacterium]